MKASLQLKMGQQLTMTPQLQQAIRLLQLSTLDLQQEIQEALDANPMLEMEEHEGDDTADHSSMEVSESKTEVTSKDDSDTPELDEQWSQEQLPDDLPVDSQWDDTYQATAGVSSGNSNAIDDDFDYDSRHASTENLQDHLEWQLNLTPMSDADREIATMLIDGVDDDGYLHTTIEDVVESMDPELEIEEEEVLAVLHRLQQFDPAGVFARDLRECLLLQLAQLAPETEWLKEARLVISDYIELLGSRDYQTLMRKTRLREDDLKSVLCLIKELNPKPGAGVSGEQAEYVVPDVIVRNVRDEWRVELNPDIAPKLRVNADYAALVRRSDNSTDNAFLRDHLQEARWFIKSLQSRNETLLKVATKIVEYQIDFFEEGEEAMKPLVLHDIAEAVGMHESTISRVTTQKYMHTPRGIFELKYFFSSHVSTDGGGECSSTAIRAMIKKLISEENARKPLSDNKIATMLGERGIQVARRTVAKYREAMLIPPSNERKQLI
ncbi:MAG: RNA polymerase factor sigma-54 [Oceanospirillaceae bacterium]|uniref:RNA polymerase factor sigma-54 n=1 Tax=unclassified Thalassolituus TaxID=2624967 RepID=UPI000C613541|nr:MULTISPECIES: RNA polymerase factor sigma-54 [unclassified Thalassolituus]MAS25754.1 RNA polymerase factor sigma-54 [Oceanospirillaceae bacterium]MAX99877.1 RNA polymerase factor sigma-54 [Oceanospirillaceae bacterium]MBL36503.1 RNA polymerase factor sigma-54 [Oceanospirillaceae bacterium]MBS54530.1 RNA polymerase factor sigma-54 [Oceanospirillaceae bacterium]